MRLKEGNKEKDILEAAVKVFAEVGFHKAKISTIAENAGVATGSVYLYLKNKDDLLNTIFRGLWEKLYEELKTISDNISLSPSEKIDAMLDLVFDIFTENPSLALVFVNEQHNLMRNNQESFINYYENFLDEGENLIKEGIEKNVFSGNLDVKIFRHFILGAIRNMLHQWAISPKDFPLNKIRQNVKYLTRHGITKI
jgi:TetR/AcrR family fatty acid metabolism transcriptional regulator